MANVDHPGFVVVGITRRSIVRSGIKLVYATPLVAATMKLSTLDGRANPIAISGGACGHGIHTTAGITCTSQGQVCTPTFDVGVCSVTGAMVASFTASLNHCSDIDVQFFVDGVAASGLIGPLGPGASTGSVSLATSPGSHLVSIQATGIEGGCNQGSLQSWAGTLDITVN